MIVQLLYPLNRIALEPGILVCDFCFSVNAKLLGHRGTFLDRGPVDMNFRETFAPFGNLIDIGAKSIFNFKG